MTYFPDSIYLDPYRLLPQHLFLNMPVIKDKRALKLHKFFITTFSINISVFFYDI